VRLKALLLISILYAPFANAVNLVCQATEMTYYWGDDCQNGCERRSDAMFSIVFDSENQKIGEVTDFSLYRGKDVYGEEITPSLVFFRLPHIANKVGKDNKGYIDISIERVSGRFYGYAKDWKDNLFESFDGKCRTGKKLF